MIDFHDKRLSLLNVNTGKVCWQSQPWQYREGIAFSRDGRFYACAIGKEILLQDVEKGRLRNRFPDYEGGPIAVLNDGRGVIYSTNKKLVLMRTEDTSGVAFLEKPCQAFTLSEDEKLLFTSLGQQIAASEVATGKLLATTLPTNPGSTQFGRLTCSPDGRTLVVHCTG